MGQTLSLAAMYCCCTASSSLCNTCFGSVAVGTTGRKRSVLLFGIVIATSLYFQYYVATSIVHQEGWLWTVLNWIPGIKTLIQNAWYTNSCDQYAIDPDDYHDGDDQAESIKLMEQCVGNSGVFRPTLLSTLYFGINAVITKVVPTLNREGWPAKYTLFGFGLLLSVFIPNAPLYTGFFLWLARFGASIFVVLQQIILIDVAYNWNDDWVERANEADRLSYGSGSNWLHGIVGICVTLYTSCLLSLGYLYAQYTGRHDSHNNPEDASSSSCAGNTWVITLTLLGIIGITAVQLTGTEGSLLTSGVISLYAVYLAFSIVSKNPVGECNPQLGQNDVWGITIGLVLTTVSLIWTGWSWSAETRLTTEAVQSAKAVNPIDNTTDRDQEETLNLDVPLINGEEAATTGIIASPGTTESSQLLRNVWKLNVVLALISCYVAMILTGWGTVNGMDESNHNAANPTIGRVNMAILGVAQWLALVLYGWTMIAPRIFPDRDFT